MGIREKYGPWALVAGGARGIGEAYVRFAAGAGLDVFVIDADAEALQTTVASVRDEHAVACEGIEVDLADDAMLASVVRGVDAREVGLLVYNAALADVGPFFKPDSGLEHELRKIAVNVRSPLALVHHFARPMLARRAGGIVLMSSGTGLVGSPFYAHYAATRAYNINLAQGLWREFRPHGVDVLACIAGMTRSSWVDDAHAGEAGEGLHYQSCEEVVDEAMAALGTRPSLMTGEHNRSSFELLSSLPLEQRIEALAQHAIRNFLGGEEPKQALEPLPSRS